ncbi:hypothetical protein OQZ33_04430 [Pedobacter sp. MC2016-05]|uniref:DUF6808 domain-containing protein n=1 Tax=Pedobacter sp. MC2016-05 TaxID=2994474 RepID=UPI002245F496|nr:hypothetical protein [Pedobacter sp. MC2016-05]MCX2473573.1 hypothetical protein [Pedobacter sp. MC2016-05]
MKNLGFKIALGAAIIIIAGLCYKLFLVKPHQTLVTNPRSEIIDKIQTDAKLIAQTVDVKGFSKAVFERKASIIGNGDITGLPVSKSVLDSLRLDNMDKTKKLQQASAINASLSAKALHAEKKTDSLLKEHYIYTDDYLTAMFTPDSSGGKFDVNYKLSLIRHDYKKRKNFFSPYRQYTDILSPDKRILIDNMQSLTIESPKTKRFGIGVQAGYYFNPATQQFNPSFGIGISYNLLSF